MWRKLILVALLLALTSIAMVQPALAQSPVWTAEYFNNPTLSGSPTVTRQDANIAFNWGLGSPVSGVNADHFSVRWATDVYLVAGNYRFYALADDNIRITFHFGFQPIIDTFAQPAVGQTLSADVNVPASGVYHIQVDYREVDQSAYAFVSFANLANNPGGPNFPAPISGINVPINAGTWVAQYWSNPGLSGDPTVTVSETFPSRDWGTGSPAPTIPADNWSARWTSTQNLPAGNYVISVRSDDGVRVFVNGVNVINQWGPATGQTYTANVYLSGGAVNFQIEFFEFGGVAYLDYQLSQVGGPPIVPPTQPPITSPTGAFVVVTAYRLNVRQIPDAVTGQILTRISQRETYPALGRNADGSWIQVNVNGIIGWVSARYVNITPTGTNLPVVGTPQVPQPQPPAGGYQVIASPYPVNVRTGPGTQFNRIARMNANDRATVIGRNAASTWWQVNYNGIVGWVSAQYAIIQQGANINSIPVTG